MEYEDEKDENKKQRLFSEYNEWKEQRDSLKQTLHFVDGTNRRILPIRDSENVRFEHFASRILEVALSSSANEQVYDFRRVWWDNRDANCQKLYVRDCYRKLFEQCMKIRKENGVFLLMGTPGTGNLVLAFM